MKQRQYKKTQNAAFHCDMNFPFTSAKDLHDWYGWFIAGGRTEG